MVQSNSKQGHHYDMENITKIKAWLSRYFILQNGKEVECNIIGWKTALAHARKYTQNLFTEVKKVEIVNAWTGEIISLQEAEERAAKWRKMRVYSGTT